MLERADWMTRAAASRQASPLRGWCLAIAVGLHVAVAAFLLRRPLPSPPMASVQAAVAMEAILMEMAPVASPLEAAAEDVAEPPVAQPPAAEAVAEAPVVEEPPAPLHVAEPIAAAVPDGELSAPPPPIVQPPDAQPSDAQPPDTRPPGVQRLGAKVSVARPVAARSRLPPAPARAAVAEPVAGPGRAPAPSPGAPMAVPDAAPSWRGEVMARLLRAKRYPEGARSRGEQGTAYATFTVDRDGHVVSASLVRGSGSYQLDAEAVALIRRAEPLPPMPAEMGGVTVTLTVPVVFGLR